MTPPQAGTQTWVLTEPGVLARAQDGEMTALHIYGSITGQRLRDVSLAKFDYINWPLLVELKEHRPDRIGLVPAGAVAIPFPIWFSKGTPSETEATRQEHRLSEQGFFDFMTKWLPDQTRGNAGPDGGDLTQCIRSVLATDDDEDRDEYYQRLSILLSALAAFTKSPNQAIAEAFDNEITTNTVKQHVHRSRKLGYLPMPRRSAAE